MNDHLAALAKGTLANGEPLPDGPPSAVVVVPVGFVSDHMEVVHDLDAEAARDRGVARPPVRAGQGARPDP